MGIAWFDGDPVEMEALELRSGGLPLLTESTPWPACPRCDAPLLFRAQIPLAMTSLLSPLDERTMMLFECHAETEGTLCDGAAAVLSTGECAPRQPPAAQAFDVFLDEAGPNPEDVAGILGRLAGEDARWPAAGQIVARGIPAAMAEQTVRILEEAGARIVLRESPPTTLASVNGALLMPFDDGVDGASRTTLPALGGLVGSSKRRMRGLIGGATAGYRDHSFTCTCGKPTRTIARLLAVSDAGVELAPAVAQLCLACGRAHYHRTGAR